MPTYATITGTLTFPEDSTPLYAEVTATPETVGRAVSLSDRVTLGPVVATTNASTGALSMAIPITAEPIAWTFDVRPLKATGVRVLKPFKLGTREVPAATTLQALFPNNATAVGPTSVASIVELIDQAEDAAEDAGTAVTAAVVARSGAEIARAGAQTAQTGAQAALAAAQGLVISDLGTTDGQTSALIGAPASETAQALATVIADVGATSFVSITKRPVHAADYGVSPLNLDNSAEFEAARVAAVGTALHLPPGDLTLARSSRFPAFTVAASSLVGDQAANSVLRFTHPAGGIDLGNGTDYVYSFTLRDVLLDGVNVCALPLRVRKGEELWFENVRILQATDALAEISDTSMLTWVHPQLAASDLGVRFLGVVGKVTLRDANIYQVKVPFKVSASAFGPIVYETGWSEQCEDLFVFDTGSAVSAGRVTVKDSHFVQPGSVARVFRAAGGLVAAELLAVQSSSFHWPSVGTPMFDFSAIDNSAVTLRARLRDLTVHAPSLGSEHLVRPNAAQQWNNFYVDAREIQGLDVDRWHIGNNVAGGVRYKTQQISDYTNDPNAVIKGFVGWTFLSESNGSLWRKTSGQGTNTGWVSVP